LLPVSSLCHHRDLRKLGQQSPNPFARQRLIVGDQRGNRAHARCSTCLLPVIGMLTNTSVPDSGWPCKTSSAAGPYSCSSRILVLDMPIPSRTAACDRPAPSSKTLLSTQSPSARPPISI